MMLFDAPEMDLRVAWSAIIPMVGATALLFLFVVSTALRALKRPRWSARPRWWGRRASPAAR